MLKWLHFRKAKIPDSYAREHSDSELKGISRRSKAKDFIEFKTSLLLDEVSNDPVGKAKVIRNILESIAVIPDEIVRAMTIQKTSKMLEIQERVLYSELQKMKRNQFRKNYPDSGIDDLIEETIPQPQPVIDDGSYHRERKLIELLLKFSDHQLEIDLLEGKIRYDHEPKPENPETIELKTYVDRGVDRLMK